MKTGKSYYHKGKKVIVKILEIHDDVAICQYRDRNGGNCKSPFGLDRLENVMDKNLLKNLIANDWKEIRNIENPDEDLQCYAINQNYRAIELIDNPTPQSQLVALKYSTSIISKIPNPSPEAIEYIVEHDIASLRLVQNISNELQLKMVEQNPSIIQFFSSPCIEAQKFVVKKGFHFINFINGPGYDILKLATRLKNEYLEKMSTDELMIRLEKPINYNETAKGDWVSPDDIRSALKNRKIPKNAKKYSVKNRKSLEDWTNI
jgi:hypothetical protein